MSPSAKLCSYGLFLLLLCLRRLRDYGVEVQPEDARPAVRRSGSPAWAPWPSPTLQEDHVALMRTCFFGRNFMRFRRVRIAFAPHRKAFSLYDQNGDGERD